MGLGERAQRFMNDPLEDMFKSTVEHGERLSDIQEEQDKGILGQKQALEQGKASSVTPSVKKEKISLQEDSDAFLAAAFFAKEKKGKKDKLAVQENAEPTQLKSFLLPISLNYKLKEQAFKHNLTMTTIIRQALQEWLQKHEI